ncbi:MAG: DUF4249 domain-containing protein [Chitinophagaceae bacterium]
MMKRNKTIYFFVMLMLTAACKEKFDPPINPQQTNYLVAEGFINAGQGSTNIQLSRTTQLKDTGQIKPESNATVSVMGEDNSVYLLKETGNGLYSSSQLNLDKNKKYRLHIITNNGKNYLSDFVAVKLTPPIDSLNWRFENDGVQIYVNTHDPQNNTKYYKWDYEETWEIHSYNAARYKYHVTPFIGVGDRNQDEIKSMYYCWKTKNSTNILLGSSVALNSDVISLQPVTLIPQGSEKLSVRYSILVRQHALDQQGYEFYRLMKKNTESIGSIFDAQPSDITGNIHSVSDPNEKVIGYIGASSVQEKRIFISNSELPAWFYSFQCTSIYVVNNIDSLVKYFTGDKYIPYEKKGFIEGYYASTSHCLDCRERGTSLKPSFW